MQRMYATVGLIELPLSGNKNQLFSKNEVEITAKQALLHFTNNQTPIRVFLSYEMARIHAIQAAANAGQHLDVRTNPNRHLCHVCPIFTVNMNLNAILTDHQTHQVNWHSDLLERAGKEHQYAIQKTMTVESWQANKGDISRVIAAQFAHNSVFPRMIEFTPVSPLRSTCTIL